MAGEWIFILLEKQASTVMLVFRISTFRGWYVLGLPYQLYWIPINLTVFIYCTHTFLIFFLYSAQQLSFPVEYSTGSLDKHWYSML